MEGAERLETDIVVNNPFYMCFCLEKADVTKCTHIYPFKWHSYFTHSKKIIISRLIWQNHEEDGIDKGNN